MKLITPLIQETYALLSANTELVALLGTFVDSLDSTNKPLAIAYNNLPVNYKVPQDKGYIVYSIESASPVTSETRTHLQNVTLKFYVGGKQAPEIVDILSGQLNAVQIYNYVVSPSGFLQLPSGDITLRFKLI